MAKENNDQIKKTEVALREEKILEFWEKNEIFSKTLSQSKGKKEFVFYEGPPTANGRPGIHHIESRAFKDIIPRFKTMQGYHVRRKAGWDTHGLPVELEVERELGLKSKKEIEEYGIAPFNTKCRESVLKYIDEWDRFTKRIAFWVDQSDAYFTFNPDYMETLWWIIGEVHKKGLLYKDYKVLPWCSRCGTALSSHELAQGYETVKDLSLTVKFQITNNPEGSLRSHGAGKSQTNPNDQKSNTKTFLLAWTTTPWTLPGNVALAVGENIDYVKVKMGGKFYILAKDRLEILEEEYEVVGEMKGSDLVGMRYEPLYPFLKDNITGEEKKKLGNAFQVYPASFVTTEEGTGIVHTAVMYGQDDFELGTAVGLPKYHLVDEDGLFTPEVDFLAGLFVKDEKTSVEIIKDLFDRGLLLKKEKYEHSYPFCWRCKTPLIYFARDSWYIRMSSLREKLTKENKSINWQPEHIKEGRFGEWLREVKDWAISRERYWGTPLPIWTTKDPSNSSGQAETLVVDSIDTLKKYTPTSGNRYFVMRHGQAESNVQKINSVKIDHHNPLTQNGRDEARTAGKKLKNQNVELIISSPFQRTRQTSEIMANELGISEDKIIFDDRIGEINLGKFHLQPISEYRAYFGYEGCESDDVYFCAQLDKMTKRPSEGESLYDVRRRVMGFLYDIDNKYKDKNILIVTHEYPIWMFIAGSQGFSKTESAKLKKMDEDFTEPSTVQEIPFVPLPHNDDYELDMHRPYIDEVELIGEKGIPMKRVSEVMDVWFDSGAMPFAQDHWPFENKKWIDGPGYPADFISEAIDQTRGWFYTMHAVGTLLGRGKAYKNVISLGHILDAKGKKMSKSVGNVVDPWEMIDKYGLDTIRFWMYSVNQPGEPKVFDEKTVDEVRKKVFNLLDNIVSFYELYKNNPQPTTHNPQKSPHVLDKWIIALFNKLLKETTDHLNNFRILEPSRAIRDFIGDFSQWYIRRSRERFKSDNEEDKFYALATTRYILLELSKLMAPFAPFIAEEIYSKMKGDNCKESVHLEAWPQGDLRFKIKEWFAKTFNFQLSTFNLLEDMKQVREIVSLGLEARQKAGIKVRQPLQKLIARSNKLSAQFAQLIKDEVNVKDVIFDPTIENEVELDTKITPELKQEGDFRELIRAVQDIRKKENLTPSDSITVIIEADDKGKDLINQFEDQFKKIVLAKEIKFGSVVDMYEIKIDNLEFKIKVEK